MTIIITIIVNTVVVVAVAIVYMSFELYQDGFRGVGGIGSLPPLRAACLQQCNLSLTHLSELSIMLVSIMFKVKVIALS